MKKLIFSREESQSDKNDFSPIRFLFFLALKSPGIVAVSIILSVVAAGAEIFGIGLLIPFLEVMRDNSITNTANLPFGGPILDSFLSFFHQYPVVTRLRIILVFFIAALSFQFIGIYSAVLMSILVQKKVCEHLGNKLYHKMLRLKLSNLYKRKSGYFLSVLGNHCLMTASMVDTIIRAIPHLMIALALLIVMFRLSWQATIASIIILGITSGVVSFFQNLAKKIGHQYKKILENRNSILMETISGLKTIKQFVKEELFNCIHKNAYEPAVKTRCKLSALAQLIGQLIKFVSLVSVVLLLLFGTYIFDVASDLWVEGLVIFVAILSRMIYPVTVLSGTFHRLAANHHIVYNVKTFLLDEECYEKEDAAEAQSSVFEREIQFDNVVFQYTDNKRKILDNMSFNIQKGKITAIVGSSGEGKSTIVDLLFKFYTPQEGQIKVDGVDLQKMRTDDWRSQIGVVSQDTFLFNETVEFNITFGDTDISQEQLITSAKQANCYDFIQQLPEGFKTILGDRGVKLSVGQRQRIAIARAFILNPSILILDEATSNLDVIAENEIKKAIEELMTGRTVIAITHRLSTIKQADSILVFEDGKVVESGHHEHLMNIPGGKYHRFVDLCV